MENVTTIRSQAAGSQVPHIAHRRAVRQPHGDLLRHAEALEAQIAEMRREADDLRRTLYEAAQVQRRICGPRCLRREAFAIAAELFPVRDLSGDFLSLFEVEDRIIFALGDIAGKGLAAGMWFSHLVATMRREFAAQADPALTISAVNRALLHNDLEIPLTSLFLASLNPRSGEVLYCNAGHPAPVVLRTDAGIELLSEGGPILGVVSHADYENGSTVLHPGDMLLAYSDGISECRNPSGAEFGMQGMMRAVRTITSGSAASTLFSLLAEIENFTEHHQREDDIALLVVKREHD